ncbi:MAG: response regulator [Elusimicrobiota bacterium]
MKRILIIDDNVQFVTLLKEYFSEDYLVYSHTDFKDLNDIILKVSQLLPDIILLDVNLLKTNGIQVVKSLQQNSLLKKIPVIMLTASDYNSVTESLLKKEPNVFGFYSKLSPLESIKEKIESINKKE